MTLELKAVEGDVYEDVPLTVGAIQELHAEMEALIEKYLTRQKALYPNQPREVLRKILLRGACLCANAQFVLKDELKEREP